MIGQMTLEFLREEMKVQFLKRRGLLITQEQFDCAASRVYKESNVLWEQRLVSQLLAAGTKHSEKKLLQIVKYIISVNMDVYDLMIRYWMDLLSPPGNQAEYAEIVRQIYDIVEAVVLQEKMERVISTLTEYNDSMLEVMGIIAQFEGGDPVQFTRPAIHNQQKIRKEESNVLKRLYNHVAVLI